MKIKLTIEVNVSDYFLDIDSDEQKEWVENEILVGDGSLLLHSNEIGDTVGEVVSVTNIQWIK
jgi:hypothetical protein